MKKARLLPNMQPCILYLNNQRVLLASISEEILTLRDLARLVMHKNKIFHSSKKFSLSECSWTQYRFPLHEPTEPTVKWLKAVLQEHLTTGSAWEPSVGRSNSILLFWVLTAARIKVQRILSQKSDCNVKLEFYMLHQHTNPLRSVCPLLCWQIFDLVFVFS